MAQKRVLIIGGGSTGCATAHDLTLRGFDVTLIERGEIASGTTGRCTCMVHSGGRYVVNDVESARECIEENTYLKQIMPPLSMESNDGVFVLLDDDDPTYAERWFQGCADCGVPVREITPEALFRLEPNVTRAVRRAALVPDAVIEPLRFALAFAATARTHGACFLRYTEVKEFLMEAGRVAGVLAQDRVTGEVFPVTADLVVNAAGPWSDKIAALAGIHIPLSLSPGIHVMIGKRFTQRVLNRMHKPSSGDVVVPHRNTTIIGTTSWSVQNCDYLHIPLDHIQQMLMTGQALVPAIARYPIHSVNAATRPLIAAAGASERELSRTFQCFDHAERDRVEGLVTVTGGKLVTARVMAEKISDLVCQKLAHPAVCQTRTYPLVSFRRFYAN